MDISLHWCHAPVSLFKNPAVGPLCLRKQNWCSELEPAIYHSVYQRRKHWRTFPSPFPRSIAAMNLLLTLISKWNRGFGFFTIFQSALNNLIDTFQKYGSSAIAANTFLRRIFAAAFPIFINPMFHKLGISWASSVFGFLSKCLIPTRFIFYLCGPKIRARGKYSAVFSYGVRFGSSNVSLRNNRADCVCHLRP